MTSQEPAPKSALNLHGLTLAQAQEVIDIYARHQKSILRVGARSRCFPPEAFELAGTARHP